MVELFEQDIRTNDRQSSKGNQLKWENNGIWYKADYTGYEGLSEYIVSGLLEKSTLLPSEYVLYNVEEIIRVGTCGAYQESLNLYDTIIVESSYSTSTKTI